MKRLNSAFLLIFVAVCLSNPPSLLADPNSDSLPPKIKVDTQIIPVTREDLQKIPANRLPAEVREEIKVPQQVRASKNNWFDYILVSIRTTVNATSITVGYMISTGVPWQKAVPAGIFGGALSGLLQINKPQIDRWLASKSQMKNLVDIPGYFKISEKKKAKLVESFFKQFSIGITYYNIVNLVAFATGIAPSILTLRPSIGAVLDLPSAGFMNILIARNTLRLRSLYPERASLIWHLSKVATLSVSMISTFGEMMYVNGRSWGPYVPVGLGTVAALTFIISQDSVLKLIDRALKTEIGSQFKNLALGSGKFAFNCASKLGSLLSFKSGKTPPSEL